MYSEKQFNSKNDQAENKYKETDPVDPMHIPDPFVLRTVGVLFAEIEVF
jgi:hypothetical protein